MVTSDETQYSQKTRAPMQVSTSPFLVYQCILEPWTRLALKSSDVVHLRLAAMPWLLLTDPINAAREIEQMFSEKHDAWGETVLAVTQTPLKLWFDAMAAFCSNNPGVAFNRAMINSSRRMAHPANKRVRANRKRLGNLD